MIEIPLTSPGRPAIVDDDFEWLSHWRWHRKRRTHTEYAIASGGVIFMHRIIAKAPKGMEVDHINHDGLDNRRENLRIVSHAENSRNRRPEARGKSIYQQPNGKWRVQINYGRQIHLGLYDDREMAEQAFRHVLARIHGDAEIPPFDQLWLPHPAKIFLKKFSWRTGENT